MQQTSSSPADVLANEYQLGTLRDTYPENKTSGSIGAPVFSLVFLAAFVYLLIRIGPALSWGFLAVLIITLLLLFNVIYRARALRRNDRQPGTSLLVYEHGLMRLQYNDRELAHSDAVRWQDIAIVWHEAKEKMGSSGGEAETYVLHLFRLQRKDGTFFGGEDYKIRSGKVTADVKRETMRYFWPQTVDSYQRGLPVSFGPLTIIQHGIHYQERLIAWAEVSVIDCSGTNNANVTINMHQARAKEHAWPIQIHVPFEQIPNAHVLRRLLIVAREQQAAPQFILFGIYPKEVVEAMAPIA